MIINSLASELDLSKSELREKLKDIGIDPSLRPQELGLEKLALISSILNPKFALEKRRCCNLSSCKWLLYCNAIQEGQSKFWDYLGILD
jgi:hypothetical protein